MADRSGIFGGDDPFAIARAWLAEAEAAEPNDPNAIALATVDGAGMPNVRMVLLKEIETDAFVFYTNYGSAKAAEIASAGKAAFVMHWKSLRRQIRVRGTTSREEGPQADAYYASRSLAKPARGLGLAPVRAAGFAGRAAGRGGADDRAPWRGADPPAVLGRHQAGPGRDRVLGGRGIPAARPLSLAPCNAGGSRGGLGHRAIESLNATTTGTDRGMEFHTFGLVTGARLVTFLRRGPRMGSDGP